MDGLSYALCTRDCLHFIVEFSFWSARIQLIVMQVFEVKQRCAVVS